MSWVVPVYYDYLDDYYCWYTEYKFLTKELSENFYGEARNHFVLPKKPFLKETSNRFMVFPKDYKTRPVFGNLEEAIEDLKNFLHYKEYNFRHEVFKVDLYQMEIAGIEEENLELKKRVEELEKKLDEMQSTKN